MHSDNPQLNEVFAYILQRNGKMIRPRLVLLCSSFGSDDAARGIDMAAAIELIHMASLIHDDVIDHAALRRGQDSVNQRWGNTNSVLVGDYLFATAFQLINRHGMKEIMEEVTDTIQIMCAGEVRQMSLAHNLDITVEDYFQKIYEKTACLFAAACRVGGLCGGLEEQQVKALQEYGFLLGCAFQIIDDLLDFQSSSTLLGKPVGSDLLEGNITLPVIYALEHPEYGMCLRQILQTKHITEEQLQRIIRILLDSQAANKALCLAEQYVQNGLKALDFFASSSAKSELIKLGEYVLTHYYQCLQQPSDAVKVVRQ
ncbi:MAG: polyprenyl synthetase family protein [Bacillota bacterium]|nr:polyprenyl synthetase family protein [Bacillota bacterium]